MVEGAGFRDRIHQFNALGVQIVGVSPDTVADNAAFAGQHGFPFLLLSDTSGDLCRSYGACDAAAGGAVQRITYLVGPEGRILHVIHHLNAPEHPVAALRFLAGYRNPTGYVEGALVYVLGKLGYDFGSDTYLAFLAAAMGGADPRQQPYLLSHLDDHPEQAANLIWTLNQNEMPVYAIRPAGSFTPETYYALRELLADQVAEGAEWISVPGRMRGVVRLHSGQVAPVIEPAVQGMYSWTTAALVESLRRAGDSDTVMAAITNYLQRVYYERPNIGQASRERAINYAATNLFQAQEVIRAAVQEGLALQRIDAEPSAVCRPDADCWEVLLTFVRPGGRFQQAPKQYRFTVDVSDLIPVAVGRIRAWRLAAPPLPLPVRAKNR
jgi:cyanobactin maturation PatA/PatG family protease